VDYKIDKPAFNPCKNSPEGDKHTIKSAAINIRIMKYLIASGDLHQHVDYTPYACVRVTMLCPIRRTCVSAEAAASRRTVVIWYANELYLEYVRFLIVDIEGVMLASRRVLLRPFLMCPDFLKAGHMKKQLIISTIIMHGALGMVSAHASGAMDVDDAQVLDANKCQLEAWGKFNRDGTERWLNPSCNLTGNLEVSWGNDWQRDGRGMYLANSQLQGKTVFKEMVPNGIGIGMLAGVVRQTDAKDADDLDAARRRSWNVYSRLLTSFSFKDDDVLLHTNVGFNRLGLERTTRLTWGLGNETKLFDRLSFIGEVFGENKGKPNYQAGIRAKLIPDHIELDLTCGNRFGSQGQGRYVVLGLRFISPELWH
jgi:hypothetical protein